MATVTPDTELHWTFNIKGHSSAQLETDDGSLKFEWEHFIDCGFTEAL